MKICKLETCFNTFEPSGRQLYCCPEHKRAHEVTAKRQWRRLKSGVRKWITAEDARDYRAETESRAGRYLRLADIVDEYESGLSLIFPDAAYERRRHRQEPEDVSYWPARSAQFVWQLDGRWLSERDRIACGWPEREVLPMTIEPVAVNRISAYFICNHWTNGVSPKRGCPCCTSRLTHSHKRVADHYSGGGWLTSPEDI